MTEEKVSQRFIRCLNSGKALVPPDTVSTDFRRAICDMYGLTFRKIFARRGGSVFRSNPFFYASCALPI